MLQHYLQVTYYNNYFFLLATVLNMRKKQFVLKVKYLFSTLKHNKINITFVY